MKPKTAVVLVLALLAAIAVILARNVGLFERTRPSDAQRQESVWKVPITNVKELAIDQRDGRKARFVRTDGAWRLVEPIEAKADAYRVNQIVGLVSDMVCQRFYEPQDPEAPGVELTGLDQPRWTITLTDDAGRSHCLKIARQSPQVGGQAETYVRPADQQRTYVVAVDFAEMLDRPLGDFRDKAVLDLKTDRIVHVRLEGRERIDLAKQNGLWHIAEPVSTPADQGAVANLLAKLAHLTADEFVDDQDRNLRAYGLETGSERLALRVWVEAEQPTTAPPATTAAATTAPASQPAEPPETYALALGSETRQQRYAKLVDSPGVFLVRASLLADLQCTLIQLRDRKVMPVQVDDVLRVQLDLPQGKADLVKKDNAWCMAEPFGGNANAVAIRNLLKKINDLEATDFRDRPSMLGGFGLDPASGTITIHQAGKSDKLTLLVGSASSSGEMTFVKRAAGDAVAVVKSADLSPILASPAGYWDTTVFQMPVGADVVEMDIARPDGKFQLKKQAGSWSMTKPLAAGTDAQNVGKLLGQLGRLQAINIVSLAETVPAEYAKAPEAIEIDFTAISSPASQPTPAATGPSTAPTQPASGPAPKPVGYRLRLARIDDKVYAWVEGAGRKPIAVGHFSSELFDVLSVELRNRTVWKIEPADIEKIKLVAGTDVLELARQGQDWKCSADPYVRIDADKVKSFLNNIKEVEAEKFASHESAETIDTAKFGLKDPWLTLTLGGPGGQSWQVTVSSEGKVPTKNRYAVASTVRGILLLSAETTGKMAMKLSDFKK